MTKRITTVVRFTYETPDYAPSSGNEVEWALDVPHGGYDYNDVELVSHEVEDVRRHDSGDVGS